MDTQRCMVQIEETVDIGFRHIEAPSRSRNLGIAPDPHQLHPAEFDPLRWRHHENEVRETDLPVHYSSEAETDSLSVHISLLTFIPFIPAKKRGWPV